MSRKSDHESSLARMVISGLTKDCDRLRFVEFPPLPASSRTLSQRSVSALYSPQSMLTTLSAFIRTKSSNISIV